MLFADTTPLPPLVCLQRLEGVRPDVRLVSNADAGGVVDTQDWYATADLLEKYAGEGRRVFVVTHARHYMPAWMSAGEYTFTPAGLVYEVNAATRLAVARSGGSP